MKFEVHYTRIVEADNFFDAVDVAKETIEGVEEVISVCSALEEDILEER